MPDDPAGTPARPAGAVPGTPGPAGAPGAGDAVAARTVLLASSSLVAVLLLSLLSLVPVPYVALSPGPVRDVLGGQPAADATADATADAAADTPAETSPPAPAGEEPLIRIAGAETYPTEGRLDLTTVSLRGGPGYEMSLGEVLVHWLDRDTSVLPRSLYFGAGTTREEADRRSAAEMTGSQEAAKVAALTQLGIDVPSTTTRRVAAVDPAAPAADALRAGDEITAVDGEPVPTFEDLRAAVSALPADAEVVLTVRREQGGGDDEVEVRTRTYAQRGATLLGIVPVVDHEFPFDVDISIDDVGGPSAGLVFALGVVDELTPGALTGGEHVAGTGAIAVDGAVLPIGGLRQKVVGARAQGAEWFLAPAEECSQVRGAVPDGITVLGVSTLAEAVAAVEAVGAGRGGTLAACG